MAELRPVPLELHHEEDGWELRVRDHLGAEGRVTRPGRAVVPFQTAAAGKRLEEAPF